MSMVSNHFFSANSCDPASHTGYLLIILFFHTILQREARRVAELKRQEIEEDVIRSNGLNGLKNGTTTKLSNGVNGSINKYLDSELQHHHNNNKKDVEFSDGYCGENGTTELINRKKQ